MTKILIIDDSSDFRALLRTYLNKELSDIEIVDYDFDNLGRPADDFNWAEYDILFLDYKLGPTEDGLEWLQTYRDKPGFPPTIVLTAEGDEYIAVKSIKLGAADYMNKIDMTPKVLAEKVEEATEFQKRTVYEEKNELLEATQILQKASDRKDDVPGQGQEIGYRFLRMIGEGAMSRVYLAEEVNNRQTVVIKILDLARVKQSKLIRRFIREANFISELDSQYVVKIFDQGMTDEYGYIVMEFFSRGDLKHRVDFGLKSEIAVVYATHIAHGLTQIHSIDVVHRDLKPANIMFRGDDSLALADFGISKKLDEVSDITTVGQILGTPHYMSPEQGEGVEVDARTDLYSLGVILYEMLTGEKPFFAKTPASLIYKHMSEPVPRLPEELAKYQQVIDGLMAKKPEDRIQTARETVNILEKLQA